MDVCLEDGRRKGTDTRLLLRQAVDWVLSYNLSTPSIKKKNVIWILPFSFSEGRILRLRKVKSFSLGHTINKRQRHRQQTYLQSIYPIKDLYSKLTKNLKTQL